MKKYIVLLLVPLLLLLPACVDTAISYRLAENCTVNIDYRMEITPDGEDISSYASEITNYWETMDFSVDTTEENGETTLTGTKSIRCENMRDAAAAMAEIFSGEDSLFYDVKFKYSPSYIQDDFSLEASISLQDMLRQNDSGSLPAAQAQALLNDAANAKYTLSIALPGKVISTNADSQNGQICTWNLAYGETARIELSTSNVFSENVEYYHTLQETRSRDTLLMVILGSAAVLLLIAGLLVLFLFIRKKRSPEIGPDASSQDIVLPPEN